MTESPTVFRYRTIVPLLQLSLSHDTRQNIAGVEQLRRVRDNDFGVAFTSSPFKHELYLAVPRSLEHRLPTNLLKSVVGVNHDISAQFPTDDLDSF